LSYLPTKGRKTYSLKQVMKKNGYTKKPFLINFGKFNLLVMLISGLCPRHLHH
jgi:hypothetical protein